jgi:shikimate kinase
MKTNIALIGFMGTGKTSVGRALAIRLNKEFMRTDDLVVESAGKSIPEIFKQDGEPRFRELEIEVVKQISDKKDIIIDCGGGVILNKVNIDNLKKNSRIILLTASPEAILERVLKDGEQRPLLENQDKLERIKQLLSLREPLYKRSADFEIDTSNLNVDQVVDKILKLLKDANV